MKAFITGGSGYVGRNLIRALKHRGDEVRALVRSDWAAGVVGDLGATVVRGDLDDVAAMREGMAGCNAVFHCAAKVEEWGPQAEFHRVNVTGTQNVLDAAKAAGVGRFVHVSTEAVLATGEPIVDADEKTPRARAPLPRYPRTKLESEQRVVAANSPSLQTVVLRPRLIWGNDDTSVLAALVDAVKQGRFLWMDEGRYPSSTCHVDNLIEGMLLAAEKGRGGEVYFVTDGPPVVLREFLTQMLETQGVHVGDKSMSKSLVLALATSVEFLWEHLKLRGAPPLTRMAVRLFGEPVTVNDGKIRRELGYVGTVTRAAGLESLRQQAL